VTRIVELSGSVVRTRRAVDALDEIQDLHGRALGITTHDEPLMRTAFADLSDAICATLGQIAATDVVSARTMLANVVAAARRRGVDGLESILLSAFLSAMRGVTGVTAETGDAAAIWLRPDRFPDRLAGGARLVPLLDAAQMVIGSVSASELAFAVTDCGGSATRLADSLRHLIGDGAAGDQEPDDPTLEPVAVACADAYVATVTAGSILRAAHLDPALAKQLAGLVSADPKTRQGPSSQLASGKALALGIWSAAAGSAEEPTHIGPIPAGLAPRRRRNLSAITTAGMAASGSRLIPAQVTTQPPTWISVAGRTAELRPPRALDPTQTGTPSDGGQPSTDDFVLVRLPGIPRTEPLVSTLPGVHPLTGEPVFPGTSIPIPHPGPPGPEPPGPGIAEAALVEAKRLDVDVRAVTVGEFIDVLLKSR
jgi:hypothetical protein